MNFVKLAVSACTVFTTIAMVACDDSASSSNDTPESVSKTGFDCSVTDGVKVVSPQDGDSYKIGSTIKVIYGTDVEGSGYRFVFKKSEDDKGKDLFKESMGVSGKGDGKTCYEQEVVLSSDIVTETETAIIRVIPYEKTPKAANSGTFKVTSK